MEVRTVTVDIEKVLEDLWDRYVNDLNTSVLISKNVSTLQEFSDTDRQAIIYCLDVLRWCKLIDGAECADMQDKADAYQDKIINEFKNRITENKED